LGFVAGQDAKGGQAVRNFLDVGLLSRP